MGRRFGWHSGTIDAYDVNVTNDLTIEGDFTFGDATTDTLTVAGLLDCNYRVDIDSTVTGTTAAVDIANSSTGKALRIDGNSTGDAHHMIEVDDEATGNSNEAVKIASARTGTVSLLDIEGNAAVGHEIQNAGTGKTFLLDANSTGDAGHVLEIDDEATGNSNEAVSIASARTGTLLTFAAEGDADKVLSLTAADGCTGSGLEIDHNETDGNAVGLKLDVASTGASAFALDVTGIATNAGIVQTNGVGASADGVTAVLRIQYNDGGGAATGYIPVMSTLT